MSDALPTDGARLSHPGLDVTRDTKIEQLLLAGLDEYFGEQYEQAIHLWTRVLFLDRAHARARAYIDRARSALAERARESDELLQSGVAAFERGESREARRLLHAAIERGAPADEALAVLDRLNRLDTRNTARSEPGRAGSRPAVAPAVESPSPATRRWSGVPVVLLAAALAGAALYAGVVLVDWRVVPGWPGSPPAAAESRLFAPTSLPVPEQGEVALSRARAVAARGHLREAMALLDLVRPTDPKKAQADRLKAEIQRQLLTLAAPAAPGRGRSGRRLP